MIENEQLRELSAGEPDDTVAHCIAFAPHTSSVTEHTHVQRTDGYAPEFVEGNIDEHSDIQSDGNLKGNEPHKQIVSSTNVQLDDATQSGDIIIAVDSQMDIQAQVDVIATETSDDDSCEIGLLLEE